ncbi:MAG TPA: ATP-binding protein [Chitinophaga sp.]
MTDKPIHILMVDDDEDDFFLVSELLQDISPAQYEIEWASTYAKGLEEIEHKRHDIYLIDYRLGPYTGIDILHHFQELNYKAPVIMLTGKGDYNIDKEAMEAGASDYLVKGEISPAMLERSVRYALDEFNHLRTLESSEKKYYGVFEKAHDLILLADRNKQIIDVNPAALRVLEYGKEELLQMNLQSLFLHSDQSDFFMAHIGDESITGQVEYNFSTKLGKKLIVLANGVMLDEQEQTFLCVAQDITDKKQKEQERAQQEKFAITGRIARVIAHEVRNPLTNILLAISQFKQGELPTYDESLLYVDIIERNCTRINQLITELLHSTRMSEMNMQCHIVNELVNKTLQQAADRLQLNEIMVHQNFMLSDALVMVDEEKILIALLNIVINAIEAMTPGQGILSVATELRNDKVHITITDNGSGIPEANKARLFDPFFTNKPKGTGLGLTSTQNIILNHKGAVHVESEEGKGTTFRISFPVYEQ